jgi:hypothetical protein
MKMIVPQSYLGCGFTASLASAGTGEARGFVRFENFNVISIPRIQYS